MSNLMTVFNALSRARRWQFWSVFAVMLTVAVLETATIGSIAPLIATAISLDPEGRNSVPFDVPFVNDLPSAFMLIAGVIILTGSLRVLLLLMSQSLLMNCSRELRTQLFRGAVHTPYRKVLGRNSAELLNGVGRAETFVGCVLDPVLQTLANGTVVLAVGAFLLWLAPGLTLLGAAVLFVLYGGITRLIGPRIVRNSEQIDAAAIRTTKAMQEASGGIRDIILQRLQDNVVERFGTSDKQRLARTHDTAILTSVPPLAIDTARLLAIAGLIAFEAQSRGGLLADLPLLGALALGVLRALPAVNMTWAGIAAIKANSFAIVAVARDIRANRYDPHRCYAHVKPIGLAQGVTFENVSFGYDPNKPVLDDISFSIAKGDHMGIAGPTGSGKSTLLDLMSGLIEPDRGRILIDGTVLSATITPGWQRSLAYVPQVVHLNDATIADNIALDGEPDEGRLMESARIACILDFIEAQPARMNTMVGERGVRLSGGQRQRIGIARALYLSPEVLIFDEATSALDPETERLVMQAVSGMAERPTIITVAHRDSTLAYCSKRLHLSSAHRLTTVAL